MKKVLWIAAAAPLMREQGVSSRRIFRLLAVVVLLAPAGCSPPPPWVYASTSGGYSVSIPDSHRQVDVETIKATILDMPIEATCCEISKDTGHALLTLAHADLPVDLDPAQEERALWEFASACEVNGALKPEEPRRFKVGGCPAVEGFVYNRIKLAFFKGDPEKEYPISGRCRVIRVGRRLILACYGQIQSWKVKDPEGQTFLDSLVLPKSSP